MKIGENKFILANKEKLRKFGNLAFNHSHSNKTRIRYQGIYFGKNYVTFTSLATSLRFTFKNKSFFSLNFNDLCR